MAVPGKFALHLDELEFLPVHYVHHFADALAVIAYGHPHLTQAAYAGSLHHLIAEELFHFRPEHPEVFKLRHRDKPDGHDPEEAVWQDVHSEMVTEYMDEILGRFHGA